VFTVLNNIDNFTEDFVSSHNSRDGNRRNGSNRVGNRCDLTIVGLFMFFSLSNLFNSNNSYFFSLFVIENCRSNGFFSGIIN
jgi:hypothetical protein